MACKTIMFPAIIISLYSCFRCSFFHFTRIITYLARVNDVFFSSLLNSNHILFYNILYLRCFIYLTNRCDFQVSLNIPGPLLCLSWIHYTININKRLQIIPRQEKCIFVTRSPIFKKSFSSISCEILYTVIVCLESFLQSD